MKHLCMLKDKRFKSNVFRWCLNGIFFPFHESFRSYPKLPYQFFKHLFMKHLCTLKDKRFKSKVFRWCLNGIFFPFHESFRSYPKLPYQFFKHLFMKHLCTLKDKRFKSKVFRWCLNGIFFRSYPKVNSCAQQSSHISLSANFNKFSSLFKVLVIGHITH